MATEKECFAFISYQREDEEWTQWLAHELEHYHFPVTLNGRKDLPKDLRPLFRDIDELSACAPKSTKGRTFRWLNYYEQKVTVRT